MALLSEIEKATDSRMIVIFLGDRRGLETKIAADILPFCSEQLARIEEPKKLSLFLYSTGGITMAGYAIANLLREYCDHYDVIIPFKALSCATLISLGADNILMTRMGQLSPIDPSINSPLAPTVQITGPSGVQYRQVPVNVEDVINYIELARKAVEIKDEELLTRLYDRMSQNVHPLVLGSVYRSREQIGFLAQMLLQRHMTDKERIRKIIEIVTRGRFSHDYLISRKEAKDMLELPIAPITSKLENLIVQLYRQYDELMQLSVPYHPEQILKGNVTGTGDLVRAIIETKDYTHVFKTRKEVTKTELKPPTVPEVQMGYLESVLSEAWETDNTL